MGIFVFSLGASGFLFSFLFSRKIDEVGHSGWALLQSKWQMAPSTSTDVDEELLLLSRLTASLRAGLSLDNALEGIAENKKTADRLQAILEGRPQADVLSLFLSDSLKTGTPALHSLGLFQRALQNQKKLSLKARSITGQSRAQAEVLSWLPWLLGALLLASDPKSFQGPLTSPFSWVLWAIAIGLTGFGREWIQSALKRALSPRSNREALEEKSIPELLLRLLGQISLGLDAETALQNALQSHSHPEMQKIFFAPEQTSRLQQLQGLLHHAALTGAPIREDLQTYLQDHYLELESRWEERVQRLPVTILAPLFACFFPASLLVLAGLFLPLFASLS